MNQSGIGRSMDALSRRDADGMVHVSAMPLLVHLGSRI
jgi:hypothetical protein